ncbi:glycosyltransferase [Ancylomarina sp. 16SWW S1-10-2]|uniref:glycosyltransferase n=1 Tax=Ancylomarina sp. 16SWW S1-10-2 TaxID=2499681 RepID=UPI0012ADB592|nr:glycosyltransferase [Ancylomarina sp. 16SWW S1-10-2]MRT93456.1 glycosyltransferase [Ancylomarina sp. 16SWW S1-10-2]
MIKISIVVPVYNAEKFVQTPLESLLGKQDIDSLEYEIVCVNDGSTDNSLSVLDSYKKRYENVRVVTQKNKGLGGARNTGIDNSKGKYILFVDADDYICDKSLNQLFNKAENGNLDILEFGAQGVSLAGVVKYTSTINMESDILTGEEYLSKILYMDSACNKLYKRSLLEDNNLKFLERVYIEDIEFNTRAVFCAKRVQAIPNIIGQFVLTEGSITRSAEYKKQLKMMNDMLEVIGIMKKYIHKNVSMESCAFLNLNKRLSFLTTSLLYRSFREAQSLNIQKEILQKLNEIQLYPIHYKTNNTSKDIFRVLVNIKPAYFFLCRLRNLKL